MMNEGDHSDSLIVAKMSRNRSGSPLRESAEPRGEAKGNTGETTTSRIQSREIMSSGLDRVRAKARQSRTERFTALLHHVTLEALQDAYSSLRRDAAPGIDGVTWNAYGTDLSLRLVDLHQRVHRGAYRPLPSRRRFIPKADGKVRPLGIAALEDKIVQRAITKILDAIYEADFVGFSYGFRPGRSQHDALDALATGLQRSRINWILDCDIRSYFDTVSHDWLIRFLELRIGDRRVIRLIRKWLTAGAVENGVLISSEMGTPQGAVISPVLSNVFLHYIFDLWANQWRKRHAQGDMMIVRYADDAVVGFQHEAEATAFLVDLRERFAQFGLTLHPEKTRILEFGRFAEERRKSRGLGKPETFAFLGFIHICSTTRTGKFLLRRKSRRDRMRTTLKAIKDRLARRMHESIPTLGNWLRQVVRGYYAYHAVPTNLQSLSAFRHSVQRLWGAALRRRGQKHHLPWARISRIADQWLPRPRTLHPWPEVRFTVKHPRWKPGALIGPAGFCAGGVR